VYGQQPDNRQAQSRRPPDIGYVPDIRRGTSDRFTSDQQVGAQPRVAVPRPSAGRYGNWNNSGYRGYSPGNKYNYYRYYPYKSYTYARPYYYYPYAFGYGPHGRGYFYFDLYYNSYVFYPPAVARYDYYGSYYGTYGYPTGELRLQVRPHDAQVFVDGSYAGTVDDFDGTFQSLRLEEGEYHVELVLPGYEPLGFDVRITTGEKVTYRGDLIPEQP
jgi:PEGA domain-containing protein